MTSGILAITGAIAGLALVVYLAWVARVVLHTIASIRADSITIPPPPDPYDDSWIEPHIEAAIQPVRQEIVDLYLAVDEGIKHVERSEKRVRAVVTGAQRRHEAQGYVDPGLEAEAGALPPVHALIEPAEGVPELPEDMGLNPWLMVPGTVEE